MDRKLQRLIVVLALLLGVTAVSLAQTSSITTTFADNNGCRGNFFDVTANVDLTITSFDIHIEASNTVSVFYKLGSSVGFEEDAGAWTFLGSAAVSGINGTPTALPVGGLTIPAGATYGLYIYASGFMPYTNGANVYSNGDLTITTSVGTCDPFSNLNIPRTWNGTIYYSIVTESPNFSGPAPAFVDGRINNFDVANPVVVYPIRTEAGTGLHIYSDAGVLLLIVTPEMIAAVPAQPEANTLIAEANGVALYRLSSGEFQVNAPMYNGKTYVLIFKELFPDGGYESFEIE